MGGPPLYVFIDEGGNFDFSSGGTKYFTITAVTVGRPFPLENALSDLRFDLVEAGIELEYFHATVDKQATRDQVFDLIKGSLRHFRVDSVIVEKSKTGPSLRELDRFYPKMLGYLLQYIVRGTDWDSWGELIVVTDRIPVNKKRRAVEKAVKTALAKALPDAIRFRVLHHDSKSVYMLQIADYFNWAIYRAWADGDDRSRAPVRRAIVSEFDIFQHGRKHWY